MYSFFCRSCCKQSIMERGIKRSSIYHSDYNNKRLKLKSTKSVQSSLENLANETLIEVFEYLDINDVYFGFFDLNNRFASLLIYLQIPFQIDLSKISKSEFDFYNENVLRENAHRISILRLSNPFAIDEIFSPVHLISNLVNLEELIFDQIHSKYLHQILKYLPRLRALILSPIDLISNPNILLKEIFCLKQLKSCQFTYRTKTNESILPIDFELIEPSSIESLTINGPFRYESFEILFSYLPKLRSLSIDYLLGEHHHPPMEFASIESKDLKFLSLNLHRSIVFSQFQTLAENFFRHVEILHLSTSNDISYSRAVEWETLISCFMPNLRVFDIQNSYTITLNRFIYVCKGDDFRSKFWKGKQWFFFHQYDPIEHGNSGQFYSMNPYRRKCHTYHWQTEVDDGSTKNDDFLTVKQLNICGKKAIRSSMTYFPNVTELTIKDYGRTYLGSMLTALESILPLKQLTKIDINCNDFPVNQVLNLLSLTPNLISLKWTFQSIDCDQLKSIKQSQTYRTLSNTNQIKNLQICHCCSLEEIRFFIHLFPRIESLRTGIVRKEIIPITQCILTDIDHLFFFHITDITRTYLPKLNQFIKSEHLLENYLIKFIDQDIYLWW